MKTLFIVPQSTLKLSSSKLDEISKSLPNNLSIFFSSQYLTQAKEIKAFLSKTSQIKDFAQVLGCSSLTPSNQSEAVLFVGEGKFHLGNLVLNSSVPIYLFEKNSLKKVNSKDFSKLSKNKKLALMKFALADRLGILVSSKPGQLKLEQALRFQQKSKKKSYLFLTDSINIGEFENFQIDFWINSACPKMNLDYPFLNLSELDISD